MTFALRDMPKEEFKKPAGVYTYNISKLSGLLATKDTPEDMVRSTIMAAKLDTYDGGLNTTEVDTLCNGIATPETPADSRVTFYTPTTKPIIDGYDPEWFAGFLSASHRFSSGSGGTIEVGKDPCVRPTDTGVMNLSLKSV
jgi:hypothetical protein